MIMEIQNLEYSGAVLRWRDNGVEREVSFDQNVENALSLKSDGIAVIIGTGDAAKAFVINRDGSTRFFIENPFQSVERKMFYYFFYEAEKLAIVFAGRRDFRCYVDEFTGSLSSPIETR
jgi:hypothetical protein